MEAATALAAVGEVATVLVAGVVLAMVAVAGVVKAVAVAVSRAYQGAVVVPGTAAAMEVAAMEGGMEVAAFPFDM